MKKRIVLTALLVFVLQCLPLTALRANTISRWLMNNVQISYNSPKGLWGGKNGIFLRIPQNSALNRTVNYTKNVVNNAVQVIW